MRIVVDMQGMQTSSRHRGIGRYTCGLVSALLRAGEDHEIFLALNGNEAETAEVVAEHFKPWVDCEHLILWHAPGPLAFLGGAGEQERREDSAIFQHAVLACRPDLFVAVSLFEGLSEEFLLSVDKLRRHCITACVVHDFIPAEKPAQYLPSAASKAWYFEQYGKLNDFDVLLCISEYTAQRARARFPEKQAVTIFAGGEDFFRPLADAFDRVRELGLTRPFVLYAGGMDERKNVPFLLEAWARVGADIRAQGPLVVVCGRNKAQRRRLERLRHSLGLSENNVRLLGFTPDDELVALYSACRLFVFPSLDEGFGLPVLEAMKCGAPVLCSDRTSLPEVLGCAEGLFDPTDEEGLARKIERFLEDEAAREALRAHCRRQAERFSWDITARRLLDGVTALDLKKEPFPQLTPLEMVRCTVQAWRPHEEKGRMAEEGDGVLEGGQSAIRLGPSHSEARLRLLARKMAATFCRREEAICAES